MVGDALGVGKERFFVDALISEPRHVFCLHESISFAPQEDVCLNVCYLQTVGPCCL